MAQYEFDYSYLQEGMGQCPETGIYDASDAPWAGGGEVEHFEQFDAEPTGDSDDTSENEEEQQSESSDKDEEDDGEYGEQDDEEDDEEDNDEDFEDVNESEEEAEHEDAEKASGNDRSAENAATTNVNINYINYESTNHNNYVHDESYYDDSTNQSAAYYDLSETNLSYAPVSANLGYAPPTSYLAYTPSFQGIDSAPASRANYPLPSSTPNHTGRTDNAGNGNPAVNAPRSIGTAPTQQKSSFFGLRKPKPNPVVPKTNTAYLPANSYHTLPVPDTYYATLQENSNKAPSLASISHPRPLVNAKHKPSCAPSKDTPKLRGGGNPDPRGKQKFNPKPTQGNARGQSGIASQPNKLASHSAPPPATGQRPQYPRSAGIPFNSQNQKAAPPTSTIRPNMKPNNQVYQAYNPSANVPPPNRQAYQAFNPAAEAAGPTKPKVNKQAAKGRALPPAPGQMQIGPLAYKNLLENIFRVPVKFDKKGIAVYTIGVSNTLKGAAKMKKKGMMLYSSSGQVKVWSKLGKM
jgi:hypothetical protein